MSGSPVALTILLTIKGLYSLAAEWSKKLRVFKVGAKLITNAHNYQFIPNILLIKGKIEAYLRLDYRISISQTAPNLIKTPLIAILTKIPRQ